VLPALSANLYRAMKAVQEVTQPGRPTRVALGDA